MRTHKLTVECTSIQSADRVVESLHDEFVDFTHWFCGLDGAGEDTPQYCIIYRGVLHPEIITVEFDGKYIYGQNNNDFECLKNRMDHMVNFGKGDVVRWEITENDYLPRKETK